MCQARTPPATRQLAHPLGPVKLRRRRQRRPTTPPRRWEKESATRPELPASSRALAYTLRSPVPPTISSSSMPGPKRSAAATLARHGRLCPAALRAVPSRSENVQPPPDWLTVSPHHQPVADNRWSAEPVQPGCNAERELQVGSRRRPRTAAQGRSRAFLAPNFAPAAENRPYLIIPRIRWFLRNSGIICSSWFLWASREQGNRTMLRDIALMLILTFGGEVHAHLSGCELRV